MNKWDICLGKGLFLDKILLNIYSTCSLLVRSQWETVASVFSCLGFLSLLSSFPENCLHLLPLEPQFFLDTTPTVHISLWSQVAFFSKCKSFLSKAQCRHWSESLALIHPLNFPDFTHRSALERPLPNGDDYRVQNQTALLQSCTGLSFAVNWVSYSIPLPPSPYV